MRTLTICAVLTALLSASSLAEDEATVWQGYLFKDEANRVRIGWPVIAMGVMEQPPHVIRGDLAGKLGPLLSRVKDNWYFWNYDLPKAEKAELATTPRVLVRIEGRLEQPEGWGYRKPQFLDDARLLTVEFLNDAWLAAWTEIFKDKRSSFRIDTDRGPITAEEHRSFAPVALAILTRMIAAPGPTDEQRKLTASIAPSAKVVQHFRTRTQWDIHRYLVSAAEKHSYKVEGIKALDPLPPGTTDIQRWFLDAEDKAAFLAKVKAGWKGDLDLLVLHHYVTRGGGTSYTRTTLREVADLWDEETYTRHRKSTREILSE